MPPHRSVSLVQRYVRTGDLDNVYAAVGKALDSAHVTSLKLEAFKYYYIADGPLGLQGIVVKSTPELLKVQQSVVDAVTPFVVKNGTAAAFVPPAEGSIVPALVEYVEVFVPDHSGEHFMPHVTTGLARKEYLDKMAAEPFDSFTFSPVGAAVYHLGNYGDGDDEAPRVRLEALKVASGVVDKLRMRGRRKAAVRVGQHHALR